MNIAARRVAARSLFELVWLVAIPASLGLGKLLLPDGGGVA